MRGGRIVMALEARKSMPAAVLLTAILLAGLSCSGGGGIAVLDDPVYGFRIGEKKEDLFKRAGDAVLATIIFKHYVDGRVEASCP